MNINQQFLQFPFQDRQSWTQFVIACAVMLSAFLIPILPTILLMGYTIKIMRQIILEKKSPSMPLWQGSDWGEMFLDGLKLYGAQFILMLPLFLLIGCGVLFLLGGSFGFAAVAEEGSRSLAPLTLFSLFTGIFLTVIFSLISVPYSIVISAAQGHVAAKRSFTAAFEFSEWWKILRAAIGQFLIVYVMLMVASFVFAFVIQIAMVTIVLMCIVPLLMIPYSVYLMLVSNALYAQAYAIGQEKLQAV